MTPVTNPFKKMAAKLKKRHYSTDDPDDNEREAHKKLPRILSSPVDQHTLEPRTSIMTSSPYDGNQPNANPSGPTAPSAFLFPSTTTLSTSINPASSAISKSSPPAMMSSSGQYLQRLNHLARSRSPVTVTSDASQKLHQESSQRSLYAENGLVAPSLSAACDGPSHSEQYTETDDLKEWGCHLQDKKCPRCNRRLKNIKPVEMGNRVKKLLIKDHFLHPLVKCPRCPSKFCIGCGKVHGDSDVVKPYISGTGFKVGYCCSEGRLFLIWALACGPELAEIPRETPAGGVWHDRLRGGLGRVTESNASPSIHSALMIPGQVTSNGIAWAKGVGYGGPGALGYGYDPSATPTGPEGSSVQPQQASVVEATKNRKDLEIYLQALGILLPCLDEALPTQTHTQFDYLEHPLIHSSLMRSPLLRHISEALRGISIEEMEATTSMFKAIADFLERVLGHQSTFPVLYESQVSYPVTHQLMHFTFNPPASKQSTFALFPTPASNENPPEESFASLRPVCGLLADAEKVCSHFIAMVDALPDSHKKERDTQALPMAERFRDLSHKVEARTSLALGNSSVPQSSVTTQSGSAEDLHRGWLRDHSVEEVSGEEFLETFSFAKKIPELEKGTHPNRMKKLLQQISDLHASLPEGIFVRYSPRYLGAMKVLIIGPKDTPYENGLFEFDLFCGPRFPEKPPEMNFRTTGRGEITFNPNLYADGKVCLSLLGTWSGEPWNSAKSTLLQVLVSIQGLILNEEPWYNEPGRELRPNKKMSDDYNTQIQQDTIYHAIIYWLKERLASPGIYPVQPRKGVQIRTGPLSGPAGSGNIAVTSGNDNEGWEVLKADTNHLTGDFSTSFEDGAAMSAFMAPHFPAHLSQMFNNLAHPADLMPVPRHRAHIPDGNTYRDGTDDRIWGEVLRKYFAVRGRAMIETAKRWDDQASRRSHMGWAVERLRKMLKEHGFD